MPDNNAAATWAAQLAPPEQVTDRIAALDQLATRHGWAKVLIATQNNRAQRQRYERRRSNNNEETERLDCWPTTLTVGSYLLHPRQGKTQLFRRTCSMAELDQIFINPRTHTNKGYQERKKNRNNTKKEEEEDCTAQQQRRKRDYVKIEEDDQEEDDQKRDARRKRRRLACPEGQDCCDWECPYSHPPRCFYAARCYFQPNCWFDHTHGLCRDGQDCTREDCWFSHRHPDLYY